MTLHGATAFPDDVGQQVVAWITDRLGGAPLGRAATAAEVRPLFADNITEHGVGAGGAWDSFVHRVARNTVDRKSTRLNSSHT